MFGNKVFLTYKRRRQSLTSNFIHGNCNQNSVCEDARNDNQTVEKTSEKHEEKTKVRFLKTQLLVLLICSWSIKLLSLFLQFHYYQDLKKLL